MIPLDLILRYWKAAVIVALTMALIGFWRARDHALIERGVALAAVRQADSILKVTVAQRAHLDTVFHTDTVQLTRWRTRTDSLRDTLFKHLTDTVLVKEFIRREDSTVAACTNALSDCATRSGLLTIERDQWRTKALALPIAQSPSHVQSNVLWAVLGFGAGFAAHLLHR